ncbi:MAG: signal peptidase I [Bdellovibrionales bacterium]|jgi:signal peptidase I|nr:signal peptidase I [Bdellovibrionales bacterium]
MSRKREKQRQNLRRVFRAEFLEAVFVAIIVATILRVFFVGVYRIPSGSMAPTLLPGDFVVAWRASYGVRVPFTDFRIGARVPGRGDVVILRLPGEAGASGPLYAKRVVGLPGDRVAIHGGTLHVNDQEVPMPWDSTHGVIHDLEPVVVPPGRVFLLSDTMENSSDSRQWGPIPPHLIAARAAVVAMSLEIKESEAADAQSHAAPRETSARPSSRFRSDRFFRVIR